jgi:hypothetical protein
MAIYFDGVHLVGTDPAELDQTAIFIGLKPEWRQEKRGRVHYDVWGEPKERLLRLHPIVCTTRQLVGFLRRKVRDGQCCYCGITVCEETECSMSPDKTHCDHWWDGV